MDMAQVKQLCTTVRMLRPQQFRNVAAEDMAMMPAAWHLVLEDVDPEDAKAALTAVAKTETWIDPNAIRTEARRLRSRRLDGVDTDVPPVDPDDVAGYIAALRQAAKRRAEPTREERPVRREVGHFERHAIEAGPDAVTPASQAHIAALRRSVSRAFPLQVPKVDAVREGQERPGRQVSPTRPVTEAEARRIDAARVRQAAGLDALTEREEAQ